VLFIIPVWCNGSFVVPQNICLLIIYLSG